jgi:deoxycytidylate deaminase
LFPCNECMKAIINKGITEIVYLNEPSTKDIYIASRRLMELSNTRCRQLTNFSIHNILKQ